MEILYKKEKEEADQLLEQQRLVRLSLLFLLLFIRGPLLLFQLDLYFPSKFCQDLSLDCGERYAIC